MSRSWIMRLREVFKNTVFISDLICLSGCFTCLMIPSCRLGWTQGTGARSGSESSLAETPAQSLVPGAAWGSVLAAPLPSCATLGSVLNLGEPHLQSGNHDSACFTGWWWKSNHMMPMACLAHGKHPIKREPVVMVQVSECVHNSSGWDQKSMEVCLSLGAETWKWSSPKMLCEAQAAS